MLGLAISNLDWILSRELKNHLDLYYNQEKEIDKDVEQFLKRQTQKVEKITLILNKLEKVIKDIKNLTIKDIEYMRKEIKILYIEIAGDFNSNILSKYLAILNKKQQSYFANVNTEKNLEQEEKLKDLNQSIYLKRLEFFTGEFTSIQKAIVKKKIKNIKSMENIRINNRKALQQSLYSIMATSSVNKKEKINKRLHLYITRKDISKNTKKLINDNTTKINEMFLSLIKSLNKEQVKNTLNRIQYIREILINYKKTYSTK